MLSWQTHLCQWSFFHYTKLVSFWYFLVQPPYVPELDGPTDVSNFDIDDLMEAKTQVSGME